MQRQTYWGQGRIVGMVLSMLLIAGSLVTAKDLPAERREATDFVSRALKAETTGENPRREALLDLALEAAARLRACPLAQRIRSGGQSLGEVR